MDYIRRTLEEELRRRLFGGKDLWETLWMTEEPNPRIGITVVSTR